MSTLDQAGQGSYKTSDCTCIGIMLSTPLLIAAIVLSSTDIEANCAQYSILLPCLHPSAFDLTAKFSENLLSMHQKEMLYIVKLFQIGVAVIVANRT
ncbi:MAG: hypothetical protein EZS28_012199 [Streblomastix strix]|uniref:Uncharacterized protein n=1 Tax=Streblomastix strix TaxID=222440 RepID=A0A5J4WBF2_9EUKA|nr:MAG: hypothetical protein EZS28_012199 [Streblomastix strix]